MWSFCGGTENMSAAPYAIPTPPLGGAVWATTKIVDTMIKDGLWDAYNNYHMGTTAENICDMWGITRQELDEFGATSQARPWPPSKSGRFKDEIVPVTVKQKKKEFVFDTDEDPRETTLEKLAGLKGAFANSDDNTVEKVDMTFEATHMTPPPTTSASSASPPATPPASTTALPPSSWPPRTLWTSMA